MTKQGIVITAVVMVLGAGALVTTQSFAQTPINTQNPVTSLVQEIAQKFGLKEADVKAVFDAHKTEVQAHRETALEDKLATLVSQGKITDAQKQLIIAKVKELEANRTSNMETFKSMTPAERKAAMEKERADLEAWAKQNNIDLKYLRFGRSLIGKGMMHHGNNGNADDTLSPTTTQ